MQFADLAFILPDKSLGLAIRESHQRLRRSDNSFKSLFKILDALATEDSFSALPVALF